jgi:hypothetical protein
LLRSREMCIVDLTLVVLVAPWIELFRRKLGMHRATQMARKFASGRRRSEGARRRLVRTIAAIDARFPGGPNCFRRSLLEIALDSGAATEKLHAGFRSGGGRNSGHAWLDSHGVPATPYDAVVTL